MTADGIVWDHFHNTNPVLFDNNATCYTDAIQVLANGLPADKKGVAYTQTHTLLLNAVDVLQQVGDRVYYDFPLDRHADVVTAIQVQGVDSVEVCSNTKTVSLTDDLTIVNVASPYTAWKLRLWWNQRPAFNDTVVVSYEARLYEADKRLTLLTYLLHTNTHSYYSGVAEPLHQA